MAAAAIWAPEVINLETRTLAPGAVPIFTYEQLCWVLAKVGTSSVCVGVGVGQPQKQQGRGCGA